MSGSEPDEALEKRVECNNDNADQEKLHGISREKKVHSTHGDGKYSANMNLWRSKQNYGIVLASAIFLWLLFQRTGYHLITFICHSMILSLGALFLWSSMSFYIYKMSYKSPKIILPEDLCNRLVLLITNSCNMAIHAFREVALGKDVKKFLYAVAVLWFASVVGAWLDFLTIIYMLFVVIFTTPMMSERNEDEVDAYAQKVKSRIKRQYSSLDEKVLQKLPKVPFIKEKQQLQEEQQPHATTATMNSK